MLGSLRRAVTSSLSNQGFRSLSTLLGYDSSPIVQSLKDKVYLVTGSTEGIGLHTSHLLAQSGATVLIHGRNTLKVKKTIKAIRTHSGNAKVFGYKYDLSSLENTRQFAAHISRDVAQFFKGRLHCLINNAGVFMEDREVTEDGLEMTWAVNVAAPFLLTSELLPLIDERIINVSSISLADSIDLDNTQQEAGYERMGHAAYGISKLAVNMWSYCLADSLQKAGSKRTVNCVDPGTVSTKLLYAGWGEISHVALKVEEADDEFWAATDPSLAHVTGEYFINRKRKKSPSVSYDKELQTKLWELLQKQTGAQIPPM